jgi:hypothetical protein
VEFKEHIVLTIKTYWVGRNTALKYFHTTKTNKVKEVETFPARIHTAVTPEEKKTQLNRSKRKLGNAPET